MLIDTHCHLDFPDFDTDRDAVLLRARERGVDFLVNVGSSLKGSEQAVLLAAHHPNIFASIGIHPHGAKDCDKQALLDIESLLNSKKVVAIGEVGLDYYRNLSDPKLQVNVFRNFIELAINRRLPLVIHSRQAEEETIGVLGEFASKPLPKIVIHCFSGKEDFLKKCLDSGFFVSFTCNVTYKKAQALRDVVKLVPLDRMFLETDAPFLAPEGKRGKRNEPAYIVELAQAVARIKQIDLDKVCAETTKNAKQFFGIV